ncbi:hypothetical protein CAEBREN_02989 [Caenorhabditis brenneri]|uniref:Uncharacterized protein n=1 Tax=Caenorhabditis brenneri TaxID=135651 RepID=G0N6Q8_CAEBE|nr:hypothetical protein CAEBREN_02989 [Caenorhabditis brenneri]
MMKFPSVVLGVFVVLVGLLTGADSGSIGQCDLSSPPPSWLTTNATGILEYAVAGQPTSGNNFCIQQTDHPNSLHELQVAYHIDLGDNTASSHAAEHHQRFSSQLDTQNGCVNNNTRIVYCFPLCLNNTLQNMVIESALKSSQPADVAQDIQRTTQLDWAITVMQVDYNDPNTHINASVFLVPDAWCSVYIGIRPKLGFDYLYEIQLGKILH